MSASRTLTATEIRTPRDGILWDHYVLDHPLGTGYHLMAWRRVIEEAFGHRTFHLLVRNDRGEVLGVLPLVFIASRFFGRFLVSVAFVNYGGILSNTVEAKRALLEAAVTLAKELNASHIELRQQEVLDVNWPHKQHKVSMRLELPDQFENLWKRFPSKLRSQIRRAQKAGMIVRIGGIELVDEFYQVFARTMRDLGTPVCGRNFFEAILQVFSKDTKICVVRWQDQPVAAGILYGFRKIMEVPWASSDWRHNRYAPNMLLYSSIMQHACAEGFQVFDFGRSSPGSGTYRFKQQWGARPVPLYWYYWLANGGPLPDLGPRNPKYRMAINLWKRMPVALTKIIGPLIVRNIP